MICCPSAGNKCPFKKTYYFICGKECLVFSNIICCPLRMTFLATYTVPLGPNGYTFTDACKKSVCKSVQQTNDY